LKKTVAIKATYALLALILAFVGTGSVWAWWVERNRIPNVVLQFEHGSTNIPIVANKKYFERPEEEHRVKLAVGKDVEPGYFSLITGVWVFFFSFPLLSLY
jgi:hypothetical protein